METLKINSGIKKYAIENEDGKVVAELLIDTNDDSIMGRLMDLHDNLMEIGKKTIEEVESVTPQGEMTTDDVRKILDINRKSVEEIISNTEKIFGKGLFKKIYADNYKLNADFIPDIDSLIEFYDLVLPLVTSIFEKKTNRYSVVKGK